MKKRHGSSHTPTLPIAIIAGLAGGLSSTVGVAISTQDPQKTLNQLSRSFTGYNPATGKWNMNDLMTGLVPVAVGIGVHFAASRLGVNRALGRAKVPLIRV